MSRLKVAMVLVFVLGFAVTARLLHAQESGQPPVFQEEIAFESCADGNCEIYIMDPVGSHLQRLPRANGWEPDWSPDRSKILFASDREQSARMGFRGGGDEEVYVMNADGSNLHRLTHTPGKGKSSNSADWSPDGKQIAFMSNRDATPEKRYGDDLYVMDADGSNVQRLTRDMGFNGTPAWSPDGKRIAFMSNRRGTPEGPCEIYVMTIDGSKAWRLTHDNWHAARPAWSPDGKRIAFMATRQREDDGYEDDGYEIYVMDADGSNVQRLTHRSPKGNNGHPAWSPDGKRIAFVSRRSGVPGISVMDADGSNLKRLTASERWAGHPDW